VRTLLIDNYDSYTYNLFQLLASVRGEDPVVVRNDDARLLSVDSCSFDSVVISPGPGRPQSLRDLGLVGEVLRSVRLPLLGVCLGHQAIAYAEGGVVSAAPLPRHGYLSRVRHSGEGLFAGIPQGFEAVRYHSLCVEEPLPESLEVTAWAEDGVVMGLSSLTLDRWGVQFHPESVATSYGRRLVENFVSLAGVSVRSPVVVSAPVAPAVSEVSYSVSVVARAVAADEVFARLYGDSPHAFWLDSSRVEEGLSRFSFLGDSSGPLSEVLSYRVPDGFVTVTGADGEVRREDGDIFSVLADRLSVRSAPLDLPFDLSCGYVGYFGYELKANCGSANRHESPTPDALWLLADRLIAIDHAEGCTYVVSMHDDSESVRLANAVWAERVHSVLAEIPAAVPSDSVVEDEPDPEKLLTRGREQYLADVSECLRLLGLGESYEICLSDRLRVPFAGDELDLYRRLRSLNPAPHGAFLRFGSLAVLSSSPEQFLRLHRDGTVESKPIKGTAPRSGDPVEDGVLRDSLATSPKTMAENLMIVDLLRNDLGRVCKTGSIEVPVYMAVESYATAHQLVSTVTGRLRPGVSAVSLVQTCFPGGSMTGAPKLRTMEIIDELEADARGVYSGALGFFGLNGTADLSIVIRTAVKFSGELVIGAGGAVVLDSTPEEEYEEMLLKAKATLRAL
jgi:para-aminobenzoate synthetase